MSFNVRLNACAVAGVTLLALAAPAWAAPTTFTVDQTTDGADSAINGVCDTNGADPGTPCTLRAAIQESNASGADDDTIAFAIPGGALQTIALGSSLPPITDTVTIDGYTQPGAAPSTNAGFAGGFNGTVNVAVDGNAAVSANPGTFVIQAASTTIKGLRVHDSSANGIQIDSGDGARIQGNIIGTSAVDNPAQRNLGAGVAVYGGDSHLIGGSDPAERNVISGNGEPGNTNFSFPPNGVHVRGNTNATTVAGNLIGTDLAGTGALGNGVAGVRVGGFTGPESTATVATNTVIGGTDPDSGNVISANGALLSSGGVQVGGQAGGGVRILRNRIGTDRTGGIALGNDPAGIDLFNDAPVTVGDANPPTHGNLLSGNLVYGIYVNNAGNVIRANLIGTNPAGDAAVPNGQAGIFVNSQASNVIGGGSKLGARNVISGNGGPGINLHEGASSNRIQRNFIGTNAAGDAALPNGSSGNPQPGIEVEGGTDNEIGAAGLPPTGAGNVISGNSGPGVAFTRGHDDPGSDNFVTGNFIGTEADGTGAIGNGAEGVHIGGGSGNYIGGESEGNVIANNAGDGVVVEDDQSNSTAIGNEISANSIFSNGGLGIDLVPGDGPTPNDTEDGDDGANLLQNFPVITAVTPGNSTTIEGTLNSVGEGRFRIEFFENTTCDPSGFGEGQKFLGSTQVDTDLDGNASFSETVPDTVPTGRPVTATATPVSRFQDEVAALQINGGEGTSEFSECFPKPVAPTEQEDPPPQSGQSEPPDEQGCPDTRDRTFRTHHAPGNRITRVRVFVNGDLIFQRRSRNKDIKRFTIEDLPQTVGTVVKIILNHSNGTKVTSTRIYNKCGKTKPTYKIKRKKKKRR